MGASTNITVGGATVNLNVAGGGAADVGYIKDGVTLTPTVELFTVDGIEQLLTAAAAWRVSEAFEVSFTMVEPTRDLIKAAWDCDNAVAGVGPWTLDFGDNQFTPQATVIVITGKTCGATQYVRTITLDKCVLSGPAPIKFSKGEETNLTVTYMCLYDDVSNNRVGQISDAAA